MQFQAVYKKWGLDAMASSLAFQSVSSKLTGNSATDDAAHS